MTRDGLLLLILFELVWINLSLSGIDSSINELRRELTEEIKNLRRAVERRKL